MPVSAAALRPNARLPRSAHVRASRDFSACFSQGKRASSRFFRAAFLARPSCAAQVGARLGMAVSRKVDVRAVERNRLRRLIREWFRLHRGRCLPGDLIISGKPEARGRPAAEVFRDLDLLVRRLGLKPTQAVGTMPGLSCPPPSVSGGDS